MNRLSKRHLVLAGAAVAGVAALVLLLGPVDVRYGLAVLCVSGAGFALYVIRALRRIGRWSAHAVRSLRGLQKLLRSQEALLRNHETHLEGTVAALSNLVSQDRFELISVLEAQAKAVEAMSGQLLELDKRLTAKVQIADERLRGSAQAVELARLARTVNDLRERMVRVVTKAEQTNFAQVEALLELRQLLCPRTAMPASRGWAAAPTTLLQLIQAVLDRQPEVVVECGSGASSIWIGYALEKLGRGRCIALEHDPEYARATREAVERHGLSSIVEVRDAPLLPVDVSGEPFEWYDLGALEDVRDVDVVFVDGPPQATGPLARFPAVPLLTPVLGSQGAVFILDDADRPDERELQDRWCAEFGVSVVNQSCVEKGWSVLALPAA